MGVETFLMGIVALGVVAVLALAVLVPVLALGGYRRLSARNRFPKWLWGLFALGAELLCIGGIAGLSAVFVESNAEFRSLSVAGMLQSSAFLFAAVGLLIVGAMLLTIVAVYIMAKWDLSTET